MKEVGERPFSADGIADQHGQKIQRFIAPEGPSHQLDLMCKGGNSPLCCEVLGQDDLIARTTQEQMDAPQERFEPLCWAWVSYSKRPQISRVCFVSLS